MIPQKSREKCWGSGKHYSTNKHLPETYSHQPCPKENERVWVNKISGV